MSSISDMRRPTPPQSGNQEILHELQRQTRILNDIKALLERRLPR